VSRDAAHEPHLWGPGYPKLEPERGIPGPIPPAPDAQARMDAEAEAWMKENAAQIADLILTHSDPALYEPDVRKHWPELWTLWQQARQAQERLRRHAINMKERYK
jgi:hypothetical protein